MMNPGSHYVTHWDDVGERATGCGIGYADLPATQPREVNPEKVSCLGCLVVMPEPARIERVARLLPACMVIVPGDSDGLQWYVIRVERVDARDLSGIPRRDPGRQDRLDGSDSQGGEMAVAVMWRLGVPDTTRRVPVSQVVPVARRHP